MAQKSDTFLPAYLAVGDDTLKREAIRKRLRGRIAALGDLTFNEESFDGAAASGDDIVAACNTLPFASPLRLVEVEKAEKLGKADAEALIAYLKAPCESTVLLLDAEKLAANTRLYKAVAALGKQAVIACASPKKADLVKWVREAAVGHGVVMAPEAASLLVQRVGENTVRLDSEIVKLAFGHKGSDPITAREVAAGVALTAEVAPWEFLDAFAARDARKCLGQLALLGDSTPIALLALCTGRVRELITAKALAARGQGNAAVLAATLKKKDWQVKRLIGWRGSYSAPELRRALIASRDAERAMKTGADAHAVLVEWLVGTMRR